MQYDLIETSMSYLNFHCDLKMMIYLVFVGIICIILINVCLWAAQHLARFLKGLVLGCIGLVSIEGLMFHILDDFLIVVPAAEKCQVYLDKFLELCKEMGIPVAAEKRRDLLRV